jgi:hypothetical protein
VFGNGGEMGRGGVEEGVVLKVCVILQMAEICRSSQSNRVFC